MSNPEALLSELNSRGVLLHANGDRLSYDAPAGAIADLIPDLKKFKLQLLELLAPDDPRVKLVLSGQTVVANKHRDKKLIAWASSIGKAVGIMRGTKWGNKFEIPRDGDRDAVCDKHAAKLENSPELLAQLSELKGRVLVCCCYPQRCHGDELARRANELPAVAAIPDDVPLTANEAAAAILANNYFNLARGGVWCIGWQQPSRSAFRFACVAIGGQLLGTNRVPSVDAADAILWAKQQQQSEETN